MKLYIQEIDNDKNKLEVYYIDDSGASCGENRKEHVSLGRFNRLTFINMLHYYKYYTNNALPIEFDLSKLNIASIYEPKHTSVTDDTVEIAIVDKKYKNNFSVFYNIHNNWTKIKRIDFETIKRNIAKLNSDLELLRKPEINFENVLNILSKCKELDKK